MTEQSIESQRSWLIATAVVLVLACSYGAPLVATVAPHTTNPTSS